MKAKFLFIIIIVLIASCSLVKRTEDIDKHALLVDCIQSWKEIKIVGLIELNYKAYAFRKDIVIRKKDNKIRFDIFDSGVLGLKPSPFISAYIDTIITLRDQHNKITSYKFTEDSSGAKVFSLFNTLSDSILSKKEDIFLHNETRLLKHRLIFSDGMKLKKIESEKDNTELFFFYDIAGELVMIECRKDKKTLAKIQIDKITRNDVKVTKI